MASMRTFPGAALSLAIACGASLFTAAAPIPQSDGRELLYVGNNHGGTVSVIDVVTHPGGGGAPPLYKVIGEFSATPDIPNRPPGAVVDDVVGSPGGDVLYVSRGILRDVAAFSTATETLLWRVPTGGVADHFTLSADGRRLFVSVESEGHVLVINTETRKPVGTFESGPGPHGIRLSPDGKRVYTGCITGDQITVADTTTLQVIKRFQFDEGVRPFEITADEARMYAQISKLHGLVELDLKSGRVTKTIHLPVPDGVAHQKAYPHTAHHGIALSPDGKYLAVGATMASYAAILSVPALDLLATIPVGEQPSWVIPSLDGGHFYVSARLGNTVSVISVVGRKEIARVKVGKYPQRMWTMRVPKRRATN